MILLWPRNVLEMMVMITQNSVILAKAVQEVSPILFPRKYLTLILPQPKTYLPQEIFQMILLGSATMPVFHNPLVHAMILIINGFSFQGGRRG